MENFPFEQVVGLIVFVIIALAQFWTKLRTGKPMPGTEEPEPEFEFPDFGEAKPSQASAPTHRTPSAPPTRRPDDALREALGLPMGPTKPPVPAQRETPPPVLARAPSPPPRSAPPLPSRPTTPAPPRRSLDEGTEPESVLDSLKRLEQETEFVRARLHEIGRMDVSAGASAEAVMRQRLAGVVRDAALARANAAAPRRRPPAREWVADRTSLRRAIVLNEILGPPRSLRPHD